MKGVNNVKLDTKYILSGMYSLRRRHFISEFIIFLFDSGNFIGENKGVEAEGNVRIERLLADPSDGIWQITF